MNVRTKLSAMIVFTILMTCVLFGINWYSNHRKISFEQEVSHLDESYKSLLSAIIEEKEFLIDNNEASIKDVETNLDIAINRLGLIEKKSSNNEEGISSLKVSLQNYEATFTHLTEIMNKSKRATDVLTRGINQFNEKAFLVVEKVDEAVANSFAEGEDIDPNLQSLSDVSRTAVFLINRISLILSQDLILNNDIENYEKKLEAVFGQLKAIKINFSSIEKRLKVQEQGYFDYLKSAALQIEKLPQQTKALAELWPEKINSETKLDNFRKQVLNKNKEVSLTIRQDLEQMEKFFFAANLAAFLGVVVFLIIGGVVIYRSITHPINRIGADLNESSLNVASISGMVSSASQQLAEGASEQAASIQETSSSLEEMSSMTRQTADSAHQADGLMAEAIQVVAKANESMTKLTSSMEEISQASQETSNIIRTIDEIAFQTNLLALNAAVEAARAGEAGAGFAVVADEVRNLAVRAAEAAKNTAQLIEGTVKQITEGSELVALTNEDFTQVAQSSEKVGELLAEIASASGEQAQGIEQVNQAVSEMDKVVQQNASNAEEAASASEEMNTQAEQMKRMVNDLADVVGLAVTANGRSVGAVEYQPVALSDHHTLPVRKEPARSKKKTVGGVADAVQSEDGMPLHDNFEDF